jgi:hypothetical protein
MVILLLWFESCVSPEFMFEIKPEVMVLRGGAFGEVFK